MKRLFFITFTFFYSIIAMGQSNYYATFKELLDKKDTASLRNFIPKWEKEQGVSGDTYAAWLNLLVLESMTTGLQVTADTMATEGFLLSDSTGNKVGAITGYTDYNSKKMAIAYRKIEEGIGKFPDRLDLWFGKTYVHLLQNEYDNAVKTLEKALDRSQLNHNKWLWTSDKSTPEEPNAFFFNCLQDYFRQLYEAQEDSFAMDLIEHTLKYYPDNIYFLNDKGALLAASNKQKEALDVFLKINKLNPSDEIVISNIAYIYKQLGNKKEAKAYYKQLLKSTDDELKELAKKELEEN